MIEINSGDKFPLNYLNSNNINIKNNELILNRGTHNLELTLTPDILNQGDRFSVYVNDALFKTEKIPLLSTKDLKINLSFRLDNDTNSISILNSSDDYINLKNLRGGLFMAKTFTVQVLSKRLVNIILPEKTSFTATSTITIKNPASTDIGLIAASGTISGTTSIQVSLTEDLVLTDSYTATVTNLLDDSTTPSSPLTPGPLSFKVANTMPITYTDLAFDYGTGDFPLPADLNATISNVTDPTNPKEYSTQIKKFNKENVITIILKDATKGTFKNGNYVIKLTSSNSDFNNVTIPVTVVEANYSKLLVTDCIITATGNRLINILFKGSVKNLATTSDTLYPGNTVLNNFYISYFGQDPVSKNENRSPLGFLNTTRNVFKVNDLNNTLEIQTLFNLPVPSADSNTQHHDMIINNIKLTLGSKSLLDILNRPLDLTVIPFTPTQSISETDVLSVTAIKNTVIEVEYDQPVCVLPTEVNLFDGLTVIDSYRVLDTLNKVIYVLSDDTPIINGNNTITILPNSVTDAFGLPVNLWGPMEIPVPINHPELDSATQDINSIDKTRIILTFSASMNPKTTADLGKYVIAFDEDNISTTDFIPLDPNLLENATMTQSPIDESIFYITFDTTLKSGNYSITPKVEPDIETPISDNYGNDLITATSIEFELINYLTPSVEQVFVTNPTAYGDSADSLVIAFDQTMLSKANAISSSIPDEAIYAIDTIENYALTPGTNSKIYLNDTLASAKTLYKDQWSSIKLNSMDLLGDFSLSNPKINIGYTFGPDIRLVRSSYTNIAFKGNIYPLCNIKTPTVLVDKYTIANDSLSLNEDNKVVLSHIVSKTSDTNVFSFFNFISKLVPSDFVATVISNGTSKVVPVTTTIEDYEALNDILSNDTQEVLFNIPSTVLNDLKGTDILEISVISEPSSLDMFGKPILPGKVSISIDNLMPAQFDNAKLTDNNTTGKEFYKNITIDVQFTSKLDSKQTVKPSEFVVTSDDSNSAFIMTESAVVSSIDSSIVTLTVLIARSDKCDHLYVALTNSTLIDAEGNLIDNFIAKPLTTNVKN